MLQKKALLLLITCICGMTTYVAYADGTGNSTGGTTITGGIGTGTAFQIIIDPISKKINVVYATGSTNTGQITSGTTTGGQNVQTGVASTGTEFQRALARMFENGLTKYSDEIAYRPDDNLTREEVAKIIGQAYIILGYETTEKNTNCTFDDNSEVDPSLSGYVTNSCKRGLFKGANGKFMPRNSITRPEAMAVLIRMFEGKISNETQDPRRGDYYLKAWALGLTTLNNQNAFNQAISRKEIAIYIQRLKNIILDPTLKNLSLSKISSITGTTTQIDTGVLSNFESLANSISVSNDPELQEAIRWMNDNGLTSYTGIAGYKPFEILNREQAAKILYLFGGIFNFITPTNLPIPTECSFQDINTADSSLQSWIEKSCQANIMKGSNKYFSPKTNMNKAQFITAMIRMFEGKRLDESTTPRWTNYFQKAQNMGIVSPADLVTFENTITRYEVALFLYRFKVKYQMAQNINSTKPQNEIVSMVPGSSSTGINNSKQGNIYIDMNLLGNGNFELGYIEIFGTRYKVIKINTEKYFSNNFVRYGDLYDLTTDQKIGSTSFIVSNGYVIEGAIRLPNNETYQMVQHPETRAYYQIKEIK